ncbi:MAG: PLDc N-terminal domain-containing protein [Cyclobacteriaceae bacterium]|nr:PLDc N-terminal domain-containing protein [Cyclobacteriaceae bacterium]
MERLLTFLIFLNLLIIISAIYDVLKRNFSQPRENIIMWIWPIIFLQFVGAFIYYLNKRRS